ncbi:MAG TPA: PAS domain S-box protein [Gemmatimonadaceae bacterium]|nr:PAS domain S-box protein [Gemmatimonadaceae bacterium]
MTPDHLLQPTFDLLQVATSIVIAIIASYAALALSSRVGPRSGPARLPWLLGGGLAVGLGIAAMHFVGMLAMHLPLLVTYDPALTALSFAVAIVASTCALEAATTSALRIGRMLVASTLFGAAVAGMHYIGMAAMHGAFDVRHDLTRVAISLAIAVVAGAVAFWLAHRLRNASGRKGFAYQLGSAVIMGGAIAGMHFTGMSAVHFTSRPQTGHDLIGIATKDLGAFVTVVGIVVLGAAILAAFLDQRMRQAARDTLVRDERYREMAEAMPQIVWTATPDGMVDYFNQRWVEYTGAAANDSLGVSWKRAVHADDLDFATERHTKSVSTGTPLDMDVRLRRGGDGEYRWYLVRGVPLRNAGGDITKWFGTCTDIQEQKRTESVLRDRQLSLEHRIEEREAEAERATALYQLLAENATDMVSTHRPDGTFNYATPSWRDYTGIDPDGRRPIDFCHADDAELVTTNYMIARRSPGLVTTVWRCKRADGSYGWLETHTRAVQSPVTQRVVTFVCATHDVTERQRREKEFQRLHEIVLAVSGASTLDEALKVTLHELCATTGWSYGEAWTQASDGHHLERSSVWSAREGVDASASPFDDGQPTLNFGDGITGSAWDSGEVIWVHDIVSDSRAKHVALAASAGFTAGVAIPVRMEKSVVAVLVFLMPAVATDDAARISFVSVVAAQLGSLFAKKRDERALRESEGKYRQLVEQAADAILLIDADGRCVEANTRAGVLCGGASPLALIGQPVDSLMSADSMGGTTMPVHSGEAITADYWMRRVDGSLLPVEVSAARLPDGRVQIIARDISGRKELERLKEEFLSVVSHELRTPLTSIRGSLGLLASGSLAKAPEKGQRMLDVAVANTDRLIRLINDILDVERINSGTVPMEPDWCDGAEIARGVAEALRPMADRATVALHVHGSPIRLWADADRITQTLTNLVGNAIKFSPEGSAIDVSVSHEGSDALFVVRDHGRGIPADKLELIFERFQQVDASDAREKGGTGLGLAISSGIVRQHGGRIWAENVPDGGSAFKFTLPMRAEVDRHDPEHRDRTDPVDEQPMRILVIEDDVELAHVIATALEAHGFEVDLAYNGASAIELHQESDADVLIVDLSLPDINGLDLLERLREGERTAGAPAIIYTASDPNTIARDRIRSLGAELATKSRVSTEALVERVVRLLEAPHPELLRAS